MVYSCNFSAAEIERLQQLLDHTRGYVGKPDWTFDDVIRWALQQAGNQFNLGLWPTATSAGGPIEPGEIYLVGGDNAGDEIITVEDHPIAYIGNPTIVLDDTLEVSDRPEIIESEPPKRKRSK